MKKVLFIAGIIVVVVGVAWFVSTRSKQSDSGKVDINDKGVNISQNGRNISEEYISDTSKLDLGISIYPNAELIDSKDAAAKININGVQGLAATYQTGDSREKVENYFKKQIGSTAIVSEAVNNSITYRVIKSSSNTGSFVNVWNEGKTIYFTVIKPLS
jgi:hypothetical protein